MSREVQTTTPNVTKNTYEVIRSGMLRNKVHANRGDGRSLCLERQLVQNVLSYPVMVVKCSESEVNNGKIGLKLMNNTDSDADMFANGNPGDCDCCYCNDCDCACCSGGIVQVQVNVISVGN